MEEVAILQPDVVLCLGIVEEIAYCACLGVEEGKGRDAVPAVVSEGLEVQRAIEGVAEGE